MKLVLLLCLALLLSCASSHMPTVYEFCSHVVANGDGGPPTCDASQCQGRPGKIGPLGPRGSPGLKGMKGEQGTSEGLEEKVQNLEDSLEELTNLLRSNEPTKGILCYMGMKDGNIPDSAITASSIASTGYHAYYGRLDSRPPLTPHGAWAAVKNHRVGEWIQVDLGAPKLVAGLITQGRSDWDQWVLSYKVTCGTTVENLATVTENGADKIFTGNTDRDTKVTNKFQEPMTCRYIRVYPQTWNGWMSMRLELIRGSCWDLY